jgi:hypothetical protein
VPISSYFERMDQIHPFTLQIKDPTLSEQYCLQSTEKIQKTMIYSTVIRALVIGFKMLTSEHMSDWNYNEYLTLVLSLFVQMGIILLQKKHSKLIN